MTYEELRAKIETKVYDSKLPYPSYEEVKSGRINREKDREMKKAQRVDRCRLRVVFANDLKEYCETVLGKKLSRKQFEAIYNYAWEEGHSSGYEEVLIYADGILEIVINFV